MEEEKRFHRRPNILLGLFVLCLLWYAGILYNAQVVNGREYLEQSSTQVTTTQTVESSRGILTDRNGKVLISNREIYTISFSPDDVAAVDGEKHSVTVSKALLRILELCEANGVTWNDTLPMTRTAPFTYTTAEASDAHRSRFQKYLDKRKWSRSELTAESPYPYASQELQDQLKIGAVLLPPRTLLHLMREDFGVDPTMSDDEARKVVGVLYELKLRSLNIIYDPYILAKDVSVDFISILNDGAFQGSTIDTRAVRQYGTTRAAHILGRVGPIDDRDELNALNADYDAHKAAGEDVSGIHHYQIDDTVGKFGAEAAFESYLCGVNGKRLITTNEEGKITSEIYSVQPQPGGTVALTIDIDFQAAVEDALAKAVEALTEEDGIVSRGGAAAVVSVKDSQVLALASYPTYDPANYGKDFNELLANPGRPMTNKALNGLYAPGSTFKPCTAAAALESGVITPKTKILTKGVYTYWQDYQPKCWIYRQSGGTHGNINVSEAIFHSCNYFMFDIARQMGIETLNEYATGFGLGQKTGIELPDSAGILDGPESRAANDRLWVGGDVLQCAIGQGSSFTPLQLANYIATLLRGGQLYECKLLKNVSAYDGSSVLYEQEPVPVSDMELMPSTVNAVKKGMGDLVVKGSIAPHFADCVVTAGAKTGSAQTSHDKADGLFVCFAPFDEPEIAIALVIEQADAGSKLAPLAADILNAYFDPGDVGVALVPEGTLLP